MSSIHGRNTLAVALIALVALIAIPAAASAKSASQHYLGIYKVHGLESPGKDYVLDDTPFVQSKTVSCTGSDIALDGMWRVDTVPYNFQVDEEGPYEPYNGVDAVSATSSGSAYTFEFLNNSESEVQVKLSVICLPFESVRADPTPVHSTFTIANPDLSGHLHNWLLGAQTTGAAGAPSATYGSMTGSTAACPSGSIAVAPGFDVTNGTAKLYKRMPNSTVTNWSWGFWSDPAAISPATVALSAWCLPLKSSAGLDPVKNHAHKLRFKRTDIDWSEQFCSGYFDGNTPCATPLKDKSPVQGYDLADAYQRVSTRQVDCGQTQKAVMAGFDLTQDDTAKNGTYTTSYAATWTWQWLGQDTYGGGDWQTVGPAGSAYHKLHFLGMDPRPKSRNFRIDNIDDQDYRPQLEAVCMYDRAGKRVAP